MLMRNTADRYGAVAKVLHWAIALLIIALTALGIYMVDLTYYDRWYNLSLEVHKALGILALELACLNVLWGLLSRAPSFPEGMKGWERLAARAMHLTLYVMMILIPVSGYAISTSEGGSVSFFGLYDVPPLFPRIPDMNQMASAIHYYLAYVTLVLVVLHAAAALKHQFVDRDGTLRKMV